MLNGTVETLQHQLRLCQKECTTKQADQTILDARFAELQEVQMLQKRDLTSLHLELAGILPQSVELSQASKPDIEERLLRKHQEAQKEPNPAKSDGDSTGTT